MAIGSVGNAGGQAAAEAARARAEAAKAAAEAAKKAAEAAAKAAAKAAAEAAAKAQHKSQVQQEAKKLGDTLKGHKVDEGAEAKKPGNDLQAEAKRAAENLKKATEVAAKAEAEAKTAEKQALEAEAKAGIQNTAPGRIEDAARDLGEDFARHAVEGAGKALGKKLSEVSAEEAGKALADALKGPQGLKDGAEAVARGLKEAGKDAGKAIGQSIDGLKAGAEAAEKALEKLGEKAGGKLGEKIKNPWEGEQLKPGQKPENKIKNPWEGEQLKPGQKPENKIKNPWEGERIELKDGLKEGIKEGAEAVERGLKDAAKEAGKDAGKAIGNTVDGLKAGAKAGAEAVAEGLEKLGEKAGGKLGEKIKNPWEGEQLKPGQKPENKIKNPWIGETQPHDLGKAGEAAGKVIGELGAKAKDAFTQEATAGLREALGKNADKVLQSKEIQGLLQKAAEGAGQKLGGVLGGAAPAPEQISTGEAKDFAGAKGSGSVGTTKAASFLGGAGDFLEDRVDDAADFGKDRIDDAKEFGEDRIEDIKNKFSDIKDFASDAKNRIEDLPEDLKDVAVDALEEIPELATKAIGEVKEKVNEIVDAADYKEQIDNLGKGDSTRIGIGGHAGIGRGRSIEGEGALEIKRNKDDTYTVSGDVKLAAKLGIPLPGGGSADASAGAGARAEFTFKNKEQAKEGAEALVRTAAVGAVASSNPVFGKVAAFGLDKLGLGPSDSQSNLLKDNLSAVELRGTAAAEIAGKAGIPGGELEGQLKGEAQAAARIELKDGKPPELIVSQSVTGTASAGAKGTAILPDVGGKVTGTAKYESRYTLPSDFDPLDLGGYDDALKQTAQSREDKLSFTYGAEGKVNGKIKGAEASLSFSGKPAEVLQSGALGDLVQGNPDKALSKLGKNVTVEASANTYEAKELQQGINAQVAGIQFSSNQKDYSDNPATYKGSGTEAADQLSRFLRRLPEQFRSAVA